MPRDRLQCEYCKAWGVVEYSSNRADTIHVLSELGWTLNLFYDPVCPECTRKIIDRQSPLLLNPNDWIR